MRVKAKDNASCHVDGHSAKDKDQLTRARLRRVQVQGSLSHVPKRARLATNPLDPPSLANAPQQSGRIEHLARERGSPGEAPKLDVRRAVRTAVIVLKDAPPM